jgi:hypothetical protein
MGAKLEGDKEVGKQDGRKVEIGTEWETTKLRVEKK